MKKAKKLLALILSLTVALTMGVSMAGMVFAAGSNTITVNKNFKGQTYTLYKIFNATVNDERAAATTTDGIAYTLIDETNHALSKEFTVTKADGTQATVKGGDWFEYVNNTNHNIEIKTGADITTELFRLWAQAYGVQIGSPITATANNDTNVKWTGLDDGYYFITTTTGSLVTVDSVAPNAIVKDKNNPPSIDKTVSGGIETGSTTTAAVNKEENTASIGNVLTYTSTIHAKQGAKKYVFKDTMSAGLTLQESEGISVKVGSTELVKNTHYTLDVFSATASPQIVVTFKQTYLDTLSADTDIVITYKAMVNKDAVIAGDGNPNTARLEYGNNSTVDEDTTKTYVYKFQLVKDNKQKKILAGAKFKLYDAETGGNVIKVVKIADGKYRVALASETGVEIEAGTPEISGLSNGKYWVEETQAPEGYNKLEGRASIVIKDKNEMATISADGNTYIEGGLEVINKEGVVLPSTGGIGTTIFYILGALLVIVCGVVLVARRRMAAK